MICQSDSRSPGHLDVLVLADGQDGARTIRVAGRRPDTQGQNHVAQPLTQHGHDRQEHDEAGECHQRIDAPLQDGVDPSPVVAGQNTDDGGQDRADGHRPEPEEHRDARPVDDAAQDVAPEIVRPQQVVQAGSLQAVGRSHLDGVIGCQHRREQGCRHEHDDEQATQSPQRLAPHSVEHRGHHDPPRVYPNRIRGSRKP
jgi:hypothetical protein